MLHLHSPTSIEKNNLCYDLRLETWQIKSQNAMFIMFNNSNPNYCDGTTDKCYFTQGFDLKVSIALHARKAYCQPLPFIVKDLIETLPF
jgi:hypothetical protein